MKFIQSVQKAVSYYIKWVTTSWTYSTYHTRKALNQNEKVNERQYRKKGKIYRFE